MKYTTSILPRKRYLISVHLFLSLSIISSDVLADAPEGYYDSVDTASATLLRNSLHDIIDDHQRYPYTSTATDTWDILDAADEDPSNSDNVIDIYLNASYSKASGGNSDYNREHSWPKSYGFPDNGSDNYPYTDAHHLFVANDSYNSSRSDKPYGTCSSDCTEKATEYNNGVGSDADESNWTTGSHTDGTWETWSGRQGNVARALMYMDVRYEGGVHGDTGYDEPDLILTDDRELMDASQTDENESIAYMGLKSVLLEWHTNDPVDDAEILRNDIVYSYQGNRNPFVDHPEYVDIVFADDSDSEDDGSDNDLDDSSDKILWINEFHYDNSGADTDEFVEIAGAAGTDLTGWSLLAYNGNNGEVYSTTSLSGSIPDQDNEFGTLSFSISGLQNGTDGFALLDANGELVQFLSYEGTFTATDGAALGLLSTDVGVAETSTTSSGYSLQLSGDGQAYDDFNWVAAAENTAAAINNEQSF